MLSLAPIATMAACPLGTPTMPAPALAVAGTADSTLQSVFQRGVTFGQFVEKATARKEGWLRLQREATTPAALLARARAVGGTWSLLVIAADFCGDSMNSVPYAAVLVDSVPGLSLRIVTPAVGSAIQATHQTMDRRNATPTFVLLDSAGTDVGCIVELPAPLRQWTNKARGALTSDSLHNYRSTFYGKDKGVSISTEIVELLEAAKAGTPKCDRASH
jgi:hypothetical protein